MVQKCKLGEHVGIKRGDWFNISSPLLTIEHAIQSECYENTQPDFVETKRNSPLTSPVSIKNLFLF